MITKEAARIIAEFPLGVVATVTSDGTPAASPKGTFLVLDDTTIAYGDIRSLGTRANLDQNPKTEVVFVDTFRRKGVRIRGNATVHTIGSEPFQTLIGKWRETWGDLADRINALVVINIDRALPLTTPPYDDGVTEDEMIALYVAKYAALYPASTK